MSRKVLVAYASKMGATAGLAKAPAVTFAGRLEPATAKGFLALRLATGNLSGDSRDWMKIRAWAADISAATQRSTRHRPPANYPAGQFLG